MNTRPAMKQKRRRTTMVPVTTMEELPVLSDDERSALLKSLKQAEAEIEAGDFTEYDSKRFRNRLLRAYRSAKR